MRIVRIRLRNRLGGFASLLGAAILFLNPLGFRHIAAQEALWVGRLGTDTLVVEGARQVGSRIEGTIVNVAAGLVVQRYQVDLDAGGNVRSLRSWTLPDISAPSPPAGAPSISVEIGNDSIRITRAGRDGPEVSAVPSLPGVVPLFDPFFNNPMALMDLALRTAVSRGDGVLRLYYVGSAGAEELPLEQTGRGELSFPYALARRYPMMAGARLHATVDAEGLTRFDAGETTFKIVTERDPWSDPLVLARQFKERGLGAGGVSSLSPTTKASGRVGSVEVEIVYGRPSRRGRQIFPDVVSFGEVWRAGANAATEIAFTEDVVVGGQPVPAGSYSVWVIPGERADTLILNKATQIWGTMYDETQDLLRVPLRREQVEERIESLTYSITSEGEAGRLELAWDDRRLSVNIEPAEDPSP
jgi:hypothetical protein